MTTRTAVLATAFAVRAEYEQVTASGGDPSLLSVGLQWRF
jgi:hypothetical protein